MTNDTTRRSSVEQRVGLLAVALAMQDRTADPQEAARQLADIADGNHTAVLRSLGRLQASQVDQVDQPGPIAQRAATYLRLAADLLSDEESEPPLERSMAGEGATAAADQINRQVSGLYQILLSDETVDGFLQRIAELTVDHVPACDTCSVSLREEGGVDTRAASDAVAERVDAHQYSSGEGPCLTAIDTGQTVKIGLMDEDDRWPRFGPLAQSEGVVSTYSVPLKVEDRTVGALNIYSLSQPFEAGDEAVGEAFAAHASVGVSNAGAYYRTVELGRQLEEALRSRDVIGQAKGIVMERERVTAERAFDMLRTVAQEKNMELRQVAELVVQSGALNSGGQ